MTHQTINGKPVHWAAEMHAQECKDGNREINMAKDMKQTTTNGIAMHIKSFINNS